MKTRLNKNSFLVGVLVAGLGLIQARSLKAQTATILHSFAGGSDGGFPTSRLIASSNTLYGTSRYGTVFSFNADGTGFTNLYRFTLPVTNAYGIYTNGDGLGPNGLVLSSNTLYGTTYEGGSAYYGTVFKINSDGTGLTVLHTFNFFDGGHPRAELVLSSNTLYGTLLEGPGLAQGSVFKINTDGTGFSNLLVFSFSGGPWGGLVLSSNILYGTTSYGGTGGGGTVFSVNTDGTSITTLHNFSDGARPYAGLILSGNTLYGTTVSGGSGGSGTVFKVNTDGTGFMTVHNFTATPLVGYPSKNSDGAGPMAPVMLSGNTLYGTTTDGGSEGSGTVFKVDTTGSGFAALYSFPNGGGGAGGLILLGDTLYGTTGNGGSSGNGTVFSLRLQPQLTIIPSAGRPVLTWPASYPRYTLQSTTNLGSSALWTTNPSPPVVINGQNTVTNPISGTQQFFRLGQ